MKAKVAGRTTRFQGQLPLACHDSADITIDTTAPNKTRERTHCYQGPTVVRQTVLTENM